MTHTQTLAPVAELKEQARRLRDRLRGKGTQITHGEALELIAHQNGARDWNTLRATADRARPAPAIGARVSGRYLGQAFAGTVKALSRLSQSDLLRVTLQFDDPVDVVTFDSFSAFRQRVTGVIGADGRSPRKTSDGVPQLIVDWPPA